MIGFLRPLDIPDRLVLLYHMADGAQDHNLTCAYECMLSPDKFDHPPSYYLAKHYAHAHVVQVLTKEKLYGTSNRPC